MTFHELPPHLDPLPWGEGATLGRLTAQLAARRVQGFTAGTFSGNFLHEPGRRNRQSWRFDDDAPPHPGPLPWERENRLSGLLLGSAISRFMGSKREISFRETLLEQRR